MQFNTLRYANLVETREIFLVKRLVLSLFLDASRPLFGLGLRLDLLDRQVDSPYFGRQHGDACLVFPSFLFVPACLAHT
jgi:hypothetical protein